MADASLRAVLSDLLGEDPYSPPVGPERLPLARAVQSCPRGEVIAARGPKGDELAVVGLEDGSVFVVPDHCPHDGGLLSDGFVEDGQLVCSRHGWEFCPHTGSCAGRPSRRIPTRQARGPEQAHS